MVCLFFFILGLAPLLNSLSNPRLGGLRVPDRLRLIAPGLLFGVGLAGLFAERKFPGE